MQKQMVINRDTLMPLGIVLLIFTSVFALYSVIISDLTQLEVQAAEIHILKQDYNYHKKTSAEYFMAISKSLSRIEGKLETEK